MGRTSGWWWAIGLLVGFLLGGCAGRQPEPTEVLVTTDEPSTLTVDDVQLEVQNRLPARLLVNIQGTFPDTCTLIDQIDMGDPQPGNVIPVTLSAARIPDEVCEPTPTPFEQRFQLPVENLPAGTYTVDVMGHTATIELTVETIAQESGPTQEGCSALGPDLPVYVSEDLGLCFLFVADFEVLEPGQGMIVIQGPVVEQEGPEPVGPSLTISVWQEGVNQPIEAFVDDLLAEADQEFNLERSQELFGRHPAEVVTGLPGQLASRQAWVNVDGRVLHFLLQPVDEEAYPDSTAQAEEVWFLVVESLEFFPSDSPPIDSPAAVATWQTHDLPEYGMRLDAPSEWTLFRGEGFAALGRPGGNPNLVTLGVLEDLPLEPEALTEALLVRYEGQGEPGAEPGPLLVDGIRAVRFTGLQSLCLDVFVPVPDAGLVRQISIHRDACPGGAPTDTVIDILNSIELIDP